MSFDINFDFNFWSILFLIAGYILGAFERKSGKANEVDQLIRDMAQLQANNRDLETANDKLNDTLFESTKENQRLLNELQYSLDRNQAVIRLCEKAQKEVKRLQKEVDTYMEEAYIGEATK